MAEPALRPKMSFEEAAALDPDRDAGELIRGEWHPVSRNTWRHAVIAGNAYALLRAYAKQHPGWVAAVGDPGSKLTRNPDTLRGPDAAIIRAERLPEGRGAGGWLEGAPEVAVEVVGDDQPVSELLEKALEYTAAGAGMVWILDPEPQRLILVTPPNQIRILGSEESLDGGEVLPGFSCRVAEFFE